MELERHYYYFLFFRLFIFYLFLQPMEQKKSTQNQPNRQWYRGNYNIVILNRTEEETKIKSQSTIKIGKQKMIRDVKLKESQNRSKNYQRRKVTQDKKLPSWIVKKSIK